MRLSTEAGEGADSAGLAPPVSETPGCTCLTNSPGICEALFPKPQPTGPTYFAACLFASSLVFFVTFHHDMDALTYGLRRASSLSLEARSSRKPGTSCSFTSGLVKSQACGRQHLHSSTGADIWPPQISMHTQNIMKKLKQRRG